MLKKMHVPFQLKSLSEAGEFEGYGSVFGVKDHGSDIVMPGAFTKSLAGWQAKGKWPPALWQHDTHEPIGPHLDMKEDETGLFVKGKLLIDDDPVARRAYAHMKAGSVNGLSIGYELIDWEWDSAKGAYLLKEIELWEVSVVTFAMNELAFVTDVKSMLAKGDAPTEEQLEHALRSVGLSPAQAKSFLASGYSGLQQPEQRGSVALKSMQHLIEKLSQ